MTAQIVALRTSLVWDDEVMEDRISDRPTMVTLGHTGDTTFTVPEVGLPPRFAIVRPGNRGYLLTLGERMRGTICIDGVQRSVEEFVRRGGEGDAPSPGGFRATAISGRDWGVIELDESGRYKLFFQFVPVEDYSPFLTPPVMYAGLGGWLATATTLAGLYLRTGVVGSEAGFRGVLLATGVLAIAALLVSLFKQDGESQASLAFSALLHAAFLFMTYQLYTGDNPFVWPGPRSLAGSYLVTRLEPEPPPPPPPPAAAAKQSGAESAAPKSPEKKPTATKGAEGASGGKGEKERARDPNAKDVPPDPPKIALFEDRNRKVLDNVLNANLTTSLGKFTGIKGDTLTKGGLGYGTGTGTGVGEGLNGTGTTRGSKGKGSGGGGNVEGDFVTNKGPIDAGKNRPGGNCVGPDCHGGGPKEVAVHLEEATGDFNGLSREEIDRVVKARLGVFKACYQKELNRTPGLGGKLTINFVIDAEGAVKSTRTSGGTLRNAEVEGCIKNNIARLKFPAKGGAVVNYPFVFQQGG